MACHRRVLNCPIKTWASNHALISNVICDMKAQSICTLEMVRQPLGLSGEPLSEDKGLRYPE